MANQKLAAMTVAGTVSATDLFYIEQGSLPKKITLSGLFGTIRFANNLLSIRTPGAAQSEKAVLSLWGTFVGSADNGTRRAADISAGFTTGTWGTQYLAFHVGIGSSANDVAGLNTEWMRIDASGHVAIGTATGLEGSLTTTDYVNVRRNTDGWLLKHQRTDGTQLAGLQSVGHAAAVGLAVYTNNAERVRIDSVGNVGIGVTPTCKLDVNDTRIRVRTARTPASATATGTQGEISWDSGFVYVCVATNTWKRAALTTW